MTRYLLDSDIIIYLRKGHWQVEQHVAGKAPKDIATTTLSRAELYYGAYYSDHVAAHVRQLDQLFRHLKTLPFCDASALQFGQMKAMLRKSGQLIEDMDIMIASIALTHRLTLVTNNIRHFARIKGLKVENWLEA